MAKQKVNKKKLVLLDMHAILHRGYHALPDFTTASGEPTGALFGLYTMLLSIIDTVNPTHIIGCYDLPQPTKRHEMFADYKAGRKETDPALVAQIQTSRKVLDAFGIIYFEEPGFEADDLLGTIVAKLQPELDSDEIDIVIASGDHDTLQLVQADKVQVYAMRRGIKDTVLYDEGQVRERYGFDPKFLVDYKGLRGDPSDNIPGIAGIGEKTATTLITEFGNLEAILKQASDDPESVKAAGVRKGLVQKLVDEATTAKFSKELATIRTDAPLELSIDKAIWRDNFDTEALLTKTTDLQFKSLVPRVKKVLGLDSDDSTQESTSPTGSLFDVAEADSSDDGNGSIEQEDIDQLHEAQLMVWLLDSDQTNPKSADIQRITNTSDLAKAHDQLQKQIKADELEFVYQKIEQPLLSVIDRMNDKGIRLDTDFLEKLESEYSQKLQQIEQSIYEIVGHEFNIASPKQLGEILFDELSLPKKGIKKTSTGNFSTAESELEKLRDTHEVIELILSHRELSKLVNTYIASFPKLVDDDGRLRATFVQWGTTTGRMSSRSPNLQNIPIRSTLGAPIRKAFVAEAGKVLVAIDYSQIELRIAAWLSGDNNLKRVFADKGDIHASVAADMFGVKPADVTKDMRSAAKTINYGILYGMGANALKVNLNQGDGEEVTKNQASEYLDKYFEAFPDLEKYQTEIKQSVKRLGYTTTFFGRRRYFKTIKSKLPYLRAQAERMAINAPIQGTQADIIKLAMVEVSDWLDKNDLRDNVSLLLQVHDELVFEIDQDKVEKLVPQIISIMEGVVDVDTTGGIVMRADAKVGPNWGEMKNVDL